MSREKIALVIHAYGEDIVGGAEKHCREYARRLSNFYDVEVLTTTSKSAATFETYYIPGTTMDGLVKVRRFETCLNRRVGGLADLLSNENRNIEAEIRYLFRNGPYVPSLNRFIRLHSNEYKAIIFYVYCFYLTAVYSLGVKNALFVPCVHDEPILKLKIFKRLFNPEHTFIFNSVEEKQLVEKKFGEVSSQSIVGGGGVSWDNNNVAYVNRPKITFPYLIYVGRFSYGKGSNVILEYFRKLHLSNPSVKLLLVGTVEVNVPKDPSIITLGRVPDIQKLELMKGAKALLNFSPNESLSLVCLEALSLGVPIIVNGNNPVLASHVEHSKLGFCCLTYEDFERAIDWCWNTEFSEDMKKRALDYVQERYSWDSIIQRVVSLINSVKF